jgi:hypothetical protein
MQDKTCECCGSNSKCSCGCCAGEKKVTHGACKRTEEITRTVVALLNKVPPPPPVCTVGDVCSAMKVAVHLGQLNFLQDELVTAFVKNVPYVECHVRLAHLIVETLLREGFTLYERHTRSGAYLLFMPHIDVTAYALARGWTTAGIMSFRAECTCEECATSRGGESSDVDVK